MKQQKKELYLGFWKISELEKSELQVIANRAMKRFLENRYPELVLDPTQEERVEEENYHKLELGWNGVKVIGRARNPQPLGDLDVIQMKFEFRRGKQTKLLILHPPTRPDVSVTDIIRKEYADVDLVMLLEPMLDGDVIVVAAPCYLKCLKEVNMAHLKMGHSQKAFQIADATINSCRGTSEALQVKGQAAANLQLYDVALEAYRAALRVVPEDGGEYKAILERIGNVKELQEQALDGKYGPQVDDEVVMADYVSDRLEMRSFPRDRMSLGVSTMSTGMAAKEPVAAGDILVVSNGVEEGSNAFAMVLDACGRSYRLQKQIESLWHCKLKPYIDTLPTAMSSFRPPEDFDGNNIVVDLGIVWCVMKNARMKGNGSSLWPLPCFFDEVAGGNHNVEVQVNGRTLVLRARRDIEAGEQLTVPAREDVVDQTQFWYKDGMLVRETVYNGGDRVLFDAWQLPDKHLPADTDWSCFVEGRPVQIHGEKDEMDTRSTDESVVDLIAGLSLLDWRNGRQAHAETTAMKKKPSKGRNSRGRCLVKRRIRLAARSGGLIGSG